MFLLEFYFISLDFDGFIVYPAPVMESLSPPAPLSYTPQQRQPLPPGTRPTLVKPCKQAAYANFVRFFKRIFGNVRGGCVADREWKGGQSREGYCLSFGRT